MGDGVKRKPLFKLESDSRSCPACGSVIYWSCPGDTGYAYCSRSAAATRMWKPGELKYLPVCDWEGKVSRRQDGKVEIYYSP